MSETNHLYRDLIDGALQRHAAALQALAAMQVPLAAWFEQVQRALAQGQTIYWIGNGGSAADAQHLSAELVGRYKLSRRGMPSVALTTDTSALTAIANDFGYDEVFARQIEALCQPGDVLVAISTSGNSRNVVRALEQARAQGVATLGLLGGTGGAALPLCNQALVIPGTETARIQEMHILVGHMLCECLEAPREMD